ncbi:MAG: hypothetical protein ACO1TE_12860 [Prosthecobacter sp.]
MQPDPDINTNDGAGPPPPAGPQPGPNPWRRGCLTCGVIALVVVLVLGRYLWLEVNSLGYHHGSGRSAAKQVIICLKQYAAMGDEFLTPRQRQIPRPEVFPDGDHLEIQSANDLFRELFKAGITSDERIFTFRENGSQADNVIGTAPGFAQAMAPGECHWMVLKHQSNHSHGRTPLIIEKAANTTWPPRWEIPAAWEAWVFGLGLKSRRHAWFDRRVVVGRADGAVEVETLRPDGTLDWHSPNNLDKDGKSWIDYLTPEQVAKLEYWDVEEKKQP